MSEQESLFKTKVVPGKPAAATFLMKKLCSMTDR